MSDFSGATLIIGASIGAVIGVAINRRRSTRHMPLIEETLSNHPEGMTKAQLQEALGMSGFLGRFNVGLALAQLTNKGIVKKTNAANAAESVYRMWNLSDLIEKLLLNNAEGLTLPQIQKAAGCTSLIERGNVVMAVGKLGKEGIVETLHAPEGTPRLERINVIRYRINGNR